jgi:hypothetical protein
MREYNYNGDVSKCWNILSLYVYRLQHYDASRTLRLVEDEIIHYFSTCESQ